MRLGRQEGDGRKRCAPHGSGARHLTSPAHLMTWCDGKALRGDPSFPEHHRAASALRVDPGISRPAPMNLSPERERRRRGRRRCEVAESTQA